MSKRCHYCNQDNPNDFVVCQKCGKLLDSHSEGIKIGSKTIIVVIFILFSIFGYLGIRIYDKICYRTVGLPDKKYNLDVVTFKIPQKWIPIGKVFYNPNSIPNLLTFFVATANPKEDVECQYFSTQYETDDGSEFQKTKEYSEVNSEEYFKKIVKKISPNAKNIKFVQEIEPNKKEDSLSKQDNTFFTSLYEDINPGTTKGKSWLVNVCFKPVHYVFTYEENGIEYKQLLEGRFVSFVQCFSKSIEHPEPIFAIKFIKCEDIFSYKVPEKNYDKNFRYYKVFKNSLKVNQQWIEYSYSERRQLLEKFNYITTESLVGGDKFDKEKFKNMVYAIEYLDKASVESIEKQYKKDFKSFLTKMLE